MKVFAICNSQLQESGLEILLLDNDMHFSRDMMCDISGKFHHEENNLTMMVKLFDNNFKFNHRIDKKVCRGREEDNMKFQKK